MTRQFPRIFLWHAVRHLQRHPLLAALNVLSVALGVAVYLAIQIANHSAHRSFAAGIDLVAGKAQLEVRGDVDETLWPVLARQPGEKAVTGFSAVICCDMDKGMASLPTFIHDRTATIFCSRTNGAEEIERRRSRNGPVSYGAITSRSQ